MAFNSFHLIPAAVGLILTVLSTSAFGQNLQWAKQIGGAGWDEGTSIKTDQNNHVYTVGLFIGTVDFDPGIGVFNLTAVGEKDAFICKLDASGDLIWAKQFGDSASIDEKSSLEIDAFGNLYITNSFVGTVDFDPGPGSFNLTSQGMDRAVFIQKLDANGNFIWAKQIGGPFVPGFPNPTHSNAIAVDAGGNLYLTGYFDGTMDFDPGPGTFQLTASVPGQTAIYISKLDPSGNFVWAKEMGPGEGSAIAMDEHNNIYSSGSASPGYITVINKHDLDGNLLWAKQLGGISGESIAVDDNGHVYTAGLCFGTNDFDPGPGVFNLTGGDSDAFISRLDSLGNFVWAGLLTGTNQVWMESLTLDMNNNLYTTGYFNGTADVDPYSPIFNLSSPVIGYDLFINKLSTQAELGLEQQGFEAHLIVYPNPTGGNLIVELDKVYDELQIVVKTVHGQVVPAQWVQIEDRIEIQMNGESGIYLLEIADQKNHRAVLKIMKN